MCTYLEDNHSAALIAGGQEFAIVIEFDARDQIGVRHVVIEGAFDLWKTPWRLSIAWERKKKQAGGDY